MPAYVSSLQRVSALLAIEQRPRPTTADPPTVSATPSAAACKRASVQAWRETNLQGCVRKGPAADGVLLRLESRQKDHRELTAHSPLNVERLPSVLERSGLDVLDEPIAPAYQRSRPEDVPRVDEV
jgi:hypothetical protein